MKRKLPTILLFLVILLAFCLRFYKVTEIPPSLNWDETSIGYNAYSVLKTGKDEWGQSLPIHFKSFGEYKLPAQVYGSIPAIAIFGLSEIGVRITPVIYGTLTVLLLYLLALELSRKKEIALIAAFLLAVSPWHIQLTRGSFESSFALFWIVLAVWLFIKGFKDSKWWVISMIPFAISVYTYNTARFFTPVFVASLFLIYRKDLLKHKKKLIYSSILFIALMLPIAPFVLSGESSARYKLVSITDDPGLVPRINERRGNSTLPEPMPTLVHNKGTYISYYFLENYLAHFSPQFLFIDGAGHRQHHVQDIGQLYLIQAPFLLYGAYLLIKKKHKFAPLLFSWLLLTFIPVSLTNDSIPHALRTLIAVPTYQIITALGVFGTYKYLKKRSVALNIVFWALVCVLFTASFLGYINNLYNRYPKLYSRDWQYGYKQVVNYIADNQDKYDLVVFSRHYGEPHIFTLFNLPYDPAKYQNDAGLNRYESNDWVWVLEFDKYYFPDLGDDGTRYKDIIQMYPDKKMLFVGKPGDFPEDIERLFTIDFLNGDRAFEVIEEL